ncbi:MAG: purine-nucleoside phosphorylase [Clostridia bacterium]|nr:purine-nucleoside phosphorylase [Clostridia bacterium]
MSDIPTPHITAARGDFADTVLMPGDPLRARFIAENFLEEPRLVNPVRGVNGFTGRYRGKRVSVMASGMGMPSIGIYSHELFRFYGVERILRVGSAGAVADGLAIGDIVLAAGACTNSAYASQFRLPGTFAPIASWRLLEQAATAARGMGLRTHVGNVLSSDTFYDDANSLGDWRKMGVLAVEMEAAALYMNAAREGREALAVLTVSDCPFTGQASTAQERETSFTGMMRLALEIA